MSNKIALICGVSGQDGAYLSRFLLQKGYRVFGTSRDADTCSFEKLESLKIRDQIEYVSMAPTDLNGVSEVLDSIRPDEIYNLSGQSSPGLSFQMPFQTIESHVLSTLNFLEVIRSLGLETRFFNASSGEIFGSKHGDNACSETTRFCPENPYASAKASAFWEVVSYRESFGIYACSGILFNHESHLRSPAFVSRKITQGVARIKQGVQSEIVLGNLNAERDWGHAEDYVRAMWLMLQNSKPADYVIASGNACSVRCFVENAFEAGGFSIHWQGNGVDEIGIDQDGQVRVRISEQFFRPVDAGVLLGNPTKAETELGWKREHTLESMTKSMVKAELTPVH